MGGKWRSLPIVYKLFSALIGAIALIVIALLTYLGGYESVLMLKKAEESLHSQSELAANDLKEHVSRLHKEIDFLSHLEVMDDIVIRDMDRRITGILEQKADDLGESIDLFLVTTDGTIPASSNSAQINTVFKETAAIKRGLNGKNFYFYLGTNLYLFSPIYGSFYTDELLGYIVLSYPLNNFTRQLETDQNFYRWLTASPSLSVRYDAHPPVYTQQEYLYDAIDMDGILQGWRLHYAMPKSVALELVYHFQTVFLIAFGIGMVLMAFLVWVILLRLIRPLRELSDTAMTIALTGDYTQTVPERGNDEIGTMAYSFNALMYSTLLSMQRLEIEREKHAERLVNLIVFFNAITRAESKEKTIEIAMEEIRRLSNARDVYFNPECEKTDDVMISLNAVGNETEGKICIKEPELLKEPNERFYAALERMLALQMERIELLGKAQAAVQAKSAFLSSMSHELRTPLGSVLSLTQYLMTQPATPEPMGETLVKIENSAYHLLGVINNILDLAKAESGKMEPHVRECNPVELIESAIELVSPLAEDKGLQIITAFEPLESPLMSDPHLFGQVVMNLLSNAIKFTETGQIHLTLRHHNGIFVFEVNDTGRGIAHEALNHLFDEFYQVRTTDNSGLKGSGLGLAISKRIALLLGGDLIITSEGEGKGTSATFEFRSL